VVEKRVLGRAKPCNDMIGQKFEAAE